MQFACAFNNMNICMDSDNAMNLAQSSMISAPVCLSFARPSLMA